MAPLSTDSVAAEDRQLLERIKGQMEANREAHDNYVAARDRGDDAGMRYDKASFEAFEEYAQQFRDEADRLGVEYDDVTFDRTVAAPAVASEEQTGEVPSEPDEQYKEQTLEAGIGEPEGTSASKSSSK